MAHRDKKKAREYRRKWRQKKRADPVYRAAERERNKQYVNPDRKRQTDRARALRTKYGITEAVFNALCAEQDHCCAICRRVFGEVKQINVDHCHSTGRVRGILCNRCNFMIGCAEDDVDVLRRTIDYLKRARRGRTP